MAVGGNPVNPGVLPGTSATSGYAASPLLSTADWGLFGGMAAVLLGMAVISPRIASITGVGIFLVIVLKYSGALTDQLTLGTGG